MFLDVAGDLQSSNDRNRRVRGPQLKRITKSGSTNREDEIEDTENDENEAVDCLDEIEETDCLDHFEGTEASEKGAPARAIAASAPRPSLLDPYQDPLMKSRIKRFGHMDATKFWKLSSGRTVEEILFEKSLRGGASFKIRSYTIDYRCEITQGLFKDQEWAELLEYDVWKLPQLRESTFKYLESVCTTMQQGEHPTAVPFPTTDWTNCNLILRTALAWMDLYDMRPCPLSNPSAHSEAFWARHGWPALKDLLNGVEGITMLDGEKFGLESIQHRNKSRRLDLEAKDKRTSRKVAGSKLDLVARDTVNNRDWCVGEAKKEWDELSTEHLRHTGVELFKKLRLISIYRCKERGEDFRRDARFFSFFSGVAGDWVDQFLGLCFLLRVKIAATETIMSYNKRPKRNIRDLMNQDSAIGGHDEQSLLDEFTLASSPIGPDTLDD
ncbi:hypothetical protein BGZ68_010396 [Mortierella alpina]|nr:hypothetical protein BGZ68_010396 [Mortierella alpina]